MKICRANMLPLALLAAGGPQLAFAAYYYEATNTVENPGLGGDQESAVHAWVDGANARIEFQEGDPSGMFSAGSYLLTNDLGETLYVVDPAERTIAEIDLAQIFQSIGAIGAATGGVMEFEISDFSSEQLGEEPGEAILGYPTTHYRFKTGYTMRMAVFGIGRENRVETELDIWCTDAIDSAGFEVWLRPDRFRTGNEDIDQLIEQQFADLDCLPLRTRSVAGSGDGSGSVTTTMEVTTLREDTPPAGTFALPEDYERVSLIPEIPGFPGADAAGEAEEEPARRPRLRDLIGR